MLIFCIDRCELVQVPCNQCSQIKGYKMVVQEIARDEVRNACNILVQKYKRDQLGIVDVEGRIILKRIVKKYHNSFFLCVAIVGNIFCAEFPLQEQQAAIQQKKMPVIATQIVLIIVPATRSDFTYENIFLKWHMNTAHARCVSNRVWL